jgi:hypothetical protein
MIAMLKAEHEAVPDSTLVQRALTPAPWLLFAGSATQARSNQGNSALVVFKQIAM